MGPLLIIETNDYEDWKAISFTVSIASTLSHDCASWILRTRQRFLYKATRQAEVVGAHQLNHQPEKICQYQLS
jgi:hypothetical protein